MFCDYLSYFFAFSELNSNSIQSINVGVNETKNFDFTGYSVLVQIARLNANVVALISLDFWESEYKVLSGSINPSIIIKKDQGKSSFSVTNNLGTSVNVLVL